MNTTDIGRDAEDKVAQYLIKQKYTILDRNWKRTSCEIDIVAQQKNCIYFVEVKYRKNTAYGSGFDYVNNRKLKQMRYAADMWVHEHNWHGDYRLMAAEIDSQQEITLVEC